MYEHNRHPCLSKRPADGKGEMKNINVDQRMEAIARRNNDTMKGRSAKPAFQLTSSCHELATQVSWPIQA
jgi:hypothetical protein